MYCKKKKQQKKYTKKKSKWKIPYIVGYEKCVLFLNFSVKKMTFNFFSILVVSLALLKSNRMGTYDVKKIPIW